MPDRSGQPALILASGSAARAELFRNAGLEFEIHPANVDEEAIRDSLTDGSNLITPADVAVVLAQAKAATVSEIYPDTLVVGADQVLVCEDKLFSKPGSSEEARDQLLSLRGKQHSLISAVACARNGVVDWYHDEVAHLKMRDFSNQFLGLYMAQAGDNVLTSVGAYQVEGPGIQLFSSIDGDYFTILGLPMLPLLGHLRSVSALQD